MEGGRFLRFMTPAKFAQDVRLRTRTNSSTFTDADMLIFMEARQRQIAKAMLKTDEDLVLIPAIRDLIANRRDYGFPADILSRIKRVEAKLDGTNWIKLTEIDLTSIKSPVATEADITNKFSNTEGGAFYDLLRKTIYLYSGTITNVTDGLKLWCNTWPTPVTDLTSTIDLSVDPSTTTHGVPQELHDTWAMGVVIDFKQTREKPIPLNDREQNFEYYLQKDIESLMHGNLDREVLGKVPYNDGSQY